MNKDEITDELQDKVLEILPDEALRELAEISDGTEDAEQKVQAILKRNGIDPVALAKTIIEEKKNAQQ